MQDYCLRSDTQRCLIWNNVIDKQLYINAYNKYINRGDNELFNEIILISILEEMANTTRLSLQYVKLNDNIGEQFMPLNVFLQMLDANVIINDIKIYNNYVVKCDSRHNKSIYSICDKSIPDHVDLIKLIAYICSDSTSNIEDINIYVPMTGMIYKIMINKIVKMTHYDSFMKKLLMIDA